MRITTILFDLDGTLLPMDQDEFVRAYFKLLAKKLAGHGYDPQALLGNIWKGVEAMVKNTGEVNITRLYTNSTPIFQSPQNIKTTSKNSSRPSKSAREI